ncbi:hypothetical protein ACOMHN_059163 [Nucella lapillus]
MSGFGGHMTIYRQISIDRFNKNNLKSTVFLLSHCHRDHMIGLEQTNFVRCLRSRNDIFLYCSEVSKLLLLSEGQFKPLAPYIFKSVVVTALPAGHCLGSVMFLIEGKEGRALYTGDFRWEKNYATSLPALCVNGHLKEIDSMYVDTTFCVPEAFYIPSRDDCLSATASMVVAWLRQSSNRYVLVSSSTKYGHEPLLSHLAKEAKTKVHTTKEKLEIYEQIRELRGVFTDDPSARIHACKWMENRDNESRLPCGYRPPRESSTGDSDAPEVLVIRPSTMWFTNEPSRLQQLVVAPSSGRGLHRVCYSFHSSYSEIRDLVSLLRPRQVFPNVLPPSDTDWLQVKERLQKFLTYKHQHNMAPAGDSQQNSRPLGLLKRKRRNSVQNLTDSEGLVFDSPEEPKRARQDSNEDDENVLPSSQKSAASNDIISPAKSDAHSSYQGSDLGEDMFAHSDEEDAKSSAALCADDGEESELGNSQSLRSYVSGDEEVSEDDQVSSPQFRHLISRDDQPLAESDLCLDCDDLGRSDSPDCGKDMCGKETIPGVSVGPDSMCFSALTTLLPFVKESDQSDGTNTDGELSKKSSEDCVEKPQCHNECLESESKAEKRGESAKNNVITSTDCSLQETVPFSCKMSEPWEEGFPGKSDGDDSFETKQDSNVDSAVNRESVSLNGEGESSPEAELTVNGGASRLSEDGKAPQDAQSSSEPGDACELGSKSPVPETGDEIVSVGDAGRSQLYSSADGEKEHQVSSVDGEKTQIDSPDGKKIKELCSEDGKKTQECASKDGEKRSSEDGEKTGECSSEDSKMIEDGKKTQECSSQHGEKTENGKKTPSSSQDGKKTPECSSQDSKKTQEAKQSCESHPGSPTNSKQETNIISSDSDSDVDCKITKSFIRKRPVNPWQVFPAPPRPIAHRICPVHQTHVSLYHPHPVQRSVQAHTGTPYRASANKTPDSKREPTFASRADMNGRKSEAGANVTERRESRIDLTLGENDGLADCGEETSATKTESDSSAQGPVNDKKVEQTDKTTSVKKTPKSEDSCIVDDADVEDNVEEEDSGRKKSKPVMTNDSSKSKPKTTSKASSDVIIIEDVEDGVSEKMRGDASAKMANKTSYCGSAQNTPSRTQLCPAHTCLSSAKPNPDSDHSHGLSQSCSPLKHVCPQDPTSTSQTDASPAKRARSDSDHCSSVHQSSGKETNPSNTPKKRQGLMTKQNKQGTCSAKEADTFGGGTTSKPESLSASALKADSSAASTSKSESSGESTSKAENSQANASKLESLDANASKSDSSVASPSKAESSSASPSKRESCSASPSKRERSVASPSKAESSSASPSKAESSSASPSKAESSSASPSKAEASGASLFKAESSSASLSKAESSSASTSKGESSSASTSKGESSSASPSKAESSSASPSKAESSSASPSKRESYVASPSKAESSSASTSKGESSVASSSKAESSDAKASKAETSGVSTSKAESSSASPSKADSSDTEEKSKEKDAYDEDGDEGEAQQMCSSGGAVPDGGESRTDNSKEADEDSDVTLPPDSLDSTLPPDSLDSTLPPDSPVAVLSSDSDSDADCKITKSFIRRVQNPVRPLGLGHQSAQTHRSMPPLRQRQFSGPRPVLGHSGHAAVPPLHFSQSGLERQCRVHGVPSMQPQGALTRPQGNVGGGVKAGSASSVCQTQRSQQSSVIDLTEDD